MVEAGPHPSGSSSPLASRLRPTITCLSVLLVGLLIAVCSGTMLAVTVPPSLAAGSAFGPLYGKAAARIVGERIEDALTVLVQPYRALAHGTSSGTLPIFTTLTNINTRHVRMKQHLAVLRAAMVSVGDQVKDVSAAFSDKSYMNCYASSAETGALATASAKSAHSCYIQDPKNTSVSSAWRYDWTWTSPGGNLTAASTGTTTFNPHTKNWYKNAPKTYLGPGTASFSVVYFENLYRSAVIDVTTPFFGPAPTRLFLGVTSITLDLGRISRFLANIPGMTPGAEAYAVDGLGMLVGASNMAPMWVIKEVSSIPTYDLAWNPLPNKTCSRFLISSLSIRRVYCRYDGGDFPSSPALNALWWQHPSVLWRTEWDDSNNKTVNVLANTSADAGLLALGEADYFVSVAPVSVHNTLNLQWLAVVLVPERDVAGPILDGNDLAVRVGAGVIGGMCVVCAVVLFFLLRPLVVIGRQMVDAATLHDEHLPAHGPRSAFREVRAVQCAMYQLCGQLKKTKAYLPAALVTELALLSEDVMGHSSAAGGGGDESDEEGSVSHGGTSQEADHAHAHSDGGCDTPPSAALAPIHNVGTRHHRTRRSSAHPKHSSGSSDETRSHRSRTSRRSAAAHSDTGSTDGSSRHTVGHVASLAAIRSRVVTVLAANVVGFHRDTRGTAAAAKAVLVTSYGALVAAVAAVAEQFRGVLDAFHGDRFFITFNAVKPCGSSHAALAMKAALQLTAGAATEDAALTRLPDPFCGRVAAGVACGPCLVGNMGSATQRRNGVVGPALAQAVLLERLCRLYAGTRVLTAGTAALDAEADMELLHLDVIPALPGDEGPAAPTQEQDPYPARGTEATSSPTVSRPPAGTSTEVSALTRVSGVRAVRPKRADGWLFALQVSTTESAFGTLNRAFVCAQEGRHRDAAALLRSLPVMSMTASAHRPVRESSINVPVHCGMEENAMTTGDGDTGDDEASGKNDERDHRSSSSTAAQQPPFPEGKDGIAREAVVVVHATNEEHLAAGETYRTFFEADPDVPHVLQLLRSWAAANDAAHSFPSHSSPIPVPPSDTHIRPRGMRDYYSRCVLGMSAVEAEEALAAAHAEEDGDDTKTAGHEGTRGE